MKFASAIGICALSAVSLAGCGRAKDKPIDFSQVKSIETIMGLSVLEPGDKILDEEHGLVWQRCSLGETWNGSACEGDRRKVSLDEAMQLAPAGWRVPSIRELTSLIRCESNQYRERRDLGDGLPSVKHVCDGNNSRSALHPAFVTKRYELVDGLVYWSSTIDKRLDFYADTVVFRYGQINGLPKDGRDDSQAYVRYVRNVR